MNPSYFSEKGAKKKEHARTHTYTAECGAQSKASGLEKHVGTTKQSQFYADFTNHPDSQLLLDKIQQTLDTENRSWARARNLRGPSNKAQLNAHSSAFASQLQVLLCSLSAARMEAASCVFLPKEPTVSLNSTQQNHQPTPHHQHIRTSAYQQKTNANALAAAASLTAPFFAVLAGIVLYIYFKYAAAATAAAACYPTG